jgi:hypothetical protein
MTTKSERICGDDTLDMPQNLLDETHPMHGQIPIPPVIGAQIDALITHKIMVPLRTRILDQLSTLITANKPSNCRCYEEHLLFYSKISYYILRQFRLPNDPLKAYTD